MAGRGRVAPSWHARLGDRAGGEPREKRGSVVTVTCSVPSPSTSPSSRRRALARTFGDERFLQTHRFRDLADEEARSVNYARSGHRASEPAVSLKPPVHRNFGSLIQSCKYVPRKCRICPRCPVSMMCWRTPRRDTAMVEHDHVLHVGRARPSPCARRWRRPAQRFSQMMCCPLLRGKRDFRVGRWTCKCPDVNERSTTSRQSVAACCQPNCPRAASTRARSRPQMVCISGRASSGKKWETCRHAFEWALPMNP